MWEVYYYVFHFQLAFFFILTLEFIFVKNKILSNLTYYFAGAFEFHSCTQAQLRKFFDFKTVHIQIVHEIIEDQFCFPSK